MAPVCGGVLDGVEGEVCPLALLLPQTLSLAVVRLRVGELGHRDVDVVQRKPLLPPLVSDEVKEPALNLDLTVFDVCPIYRLKKLDSILCLGNF